MGKSKTVPDSTVQLERAKGPIRVIATREGTYGGNGAAPTMRTSGEQFEIDQPEHFSRRWMVLANSPEAAEYSRKAAAADELDTLTGERLATGATGEQLALALDEIKKLKAQIKALNAESVTQASSAPADAATTDAATTDAAPTDAATTDAATTDEASADAAGDEVPPSDPQPEADQTSTTLTRRRRSTAA